MRRFIICEEDLRTLEAITKLAPTYWAISDRIRSDPLEAHRISDSDVSKLLSEATKTQRRMIIDQIISYLESHSEKLNGVTIYYGRETKTFVESLMKAQS